MNLRPSPAATGTLSQPSHEKAAGPLGFVHPAGQRQRLHQELLDAWLRVVTIGQPGSPLEGVHCGGQRSPLQRSPARAGQQDRRPPPVASADGKVRGEIMPGGARPQAGLLQCRQRRRSQPLMPRRQQRLQHRLPGERVPEPERGPI